MATNTRMSFCKIRFVNILLKNLRQQHFMSVRRLSHTKMTVGKTIDGKIIELEFGHMAKFADGAVVAKYGDTAVLSTAVSSRSMVETSASSFLPLSVDYRQKSAAGGRIPTNHLRRDMGASDKEILTCRVIDRSIRSSFPQGYLNDTQVTCNLLAVDGINDPDVLSINAASAALAVSDIPWNGPVGAVRVGSSPSGEFYLNPTRKQQQTSIMNLVVVANNMEEVVMVEGDARNVDEGMMLEGLSFGVENAALIARDIGTNVADIARRKRSFIPPVKPPDHLVEKAEEIGGDRIRTILTDSSHDKISRDKALQDVRYYIVEQLTGLGYDNKLLMHEAVGTVIKKIFRNQILDTRTRCDGRHVKQIREISSRVDLYPPLHGSALFQRGQTQVLCTVTFDSLQAAVKTDPMSVITGATKEKNFMLHYEFPGYAVNEIKPPGASKNRRELGHGALAEKGLRPVIPEDFPFCIRLTSEVLESNGSSSMASICGGSLALLDAGVQLKEPAAGVAMGLVSKQYPIKSTEDHCLLRDLLGIEDYFGDMDLKIGGTRGGLTTIQMDLKLPGIPLRVLNIAVTEAQKAIRDIIIRMLTGIKVRDSLKPNGPVVEKLTVLPAKRSMFVGPGGIHLKQLRSQTGVIVTYVDESTYEIFAPNKDAMDEAQEMMSAWLEAKKEPVLEFNAIYEAKITEVREYGVMVQIHPAMDPVLLHNSQLDHRKVSHASALGLNVGDIISVKFFGRDPTTGNIRISRKVITAPSSQTFRFMRDE